MMFSINNYIDNSSQLLNYTEKYPWEIIKNIDELISIFIENLEDDYVISDDKIAIHKSAVIESNVVLKSPIIIGKNCFIGSNAYLRGGVILKDNVRIGTGCEIKSSLIFDNSSIAHFNFIGDSIIGSNVNFEAGSITANHYNERENKTIYVLSNSQIIDTKSEKFGALVGDNSKIGANAVLCPGTILDKNSIVKRLELIEQIKK